MLVEMLESVVLRVLPSGGQRRARRNAWAAMSSDAVHARARREAAEAIARAEAAALARGRAVAAR